MRAYLMTLPFLTLLPLQGTPALSNSPHSPYRQLNVLVNDMTALKEEWQIIKTKMESEVQQFPIEQKKQETIVQQLLAENKQLSTDIKALRNTSLEQAKTINDLTQALKKLEQSQQNNFSLENVKKSITFLQKDLNKTQQELGNLSEAFDQKLANNESKNLEIFQSQIENARKESLRIFQSINNKFQNFAQQIKNEFEASTQNQFCRHTIRSGESLASIANDYHTTPSAILSANNLESPQNLHVGDTLIIPQN